ncbi:MAG: type II toxin-antitoxin system VapC family toxin [Alphaproteobacteria bacterium]|jgi:PIN domain nuclease of toxin-antitoxin system|nr:type II toxin-antitoxin system VapC family toxin [Alphaproteobacteria bacterium]
MNLLLDTHIAIWAIEDNPRLSHAARALILDPAAVLHVSVASLWEIAIKHALPQGARAMPVSSAIALDAFRRSGFVIRPILAHHVQATEALQRFHDDPFDRLLVAIAITEPYRLVTHDARLSAYPAQVEIV